MKTAEQLHDWIAICEAKARYCRTLDTKDWDAYREIFTEDYELDVSDGTGAPVIKGRDAAIAFVRRSIEKAITVHQVHLPEIEVDGDEARAVWAMHDRVIYPDGPALTGYGHYHECWRRCDGAWRIAALKLTRLHLDVKPPS